MIKMTVETAPPIQTKWGTAKVGNTGYYTISENSKGKYKQLLHRVPSEETRRKISKSNKGKPAWNSRR